mgnify:CR=1 FL=1
MIKVQITISKALKPFLALETEQEILVRNSMIIFPFIQNETISYGKAAEILNLRKLDLITLYGKMEPPYFNQTKEELEEDLKNIKSALEK